MPTSIACGNWPRWPGMVALLGSWCEGGIAHRQALAGGCPDVLASVAGPRRANFAALAAGRGWRLGAAGHGDRRRTPLGRRRAAVADRRGLIAIFSRVFAMADWLNGRLQPRAATARYGCGRRACPMCAGDGLLFDGSECRGEEYDELLRGAAAWRRRRWWRYLDFPRIEDYERAHAAGAAAVLSKPLCLADLLWQLERVIEREGGKVRK